MEIVAERGVAGVTHRAVTERAGVPLTSATYYFASISEMIVEALRLFAADRNGLFDDIAERVTARGSTLADAVITVLDAISATPALDRLAFYEMLCDSARSSAETTFAQDTLDHYTDRLGELLSGITHGGTDDRCDDNVAISDDAHAGGDAGARDAGSGESPAGGEDSEPRDEADMALLRGILSLELGRNLLCLVHSGFGPQGQAYEMLRYMLIGHHVARHDPDLAESVMRRPVS